MNHLPFQRISWKIPALLILTGVLLGGLMGAGGNKLVVALLPFVLLIGVGFMIMVLNRPFTALLLVVFFQVLIPDYMGIPLIPGFMPLPPSFIMLLLLSATVFLSVMLEKNHSLGLDSPSQQLLFFATFFLLSSVLSSGFEGGVVSTWGRAIAMPYLFMMTVLYIVKSERQVEMLFDVLLVAGVLTSLYALVEFLMGYNVLIEKFSNRSDNILDVPYWGFTQGAHAQSFIYRVHSVFTNTLFFSGYISMILPYAFLQYEYAESKQMKRYYLLSSLICLMGLILSFSRGPIVGLFISLIVLSFFSKRTRKVFIMMIVVAMFAFAAAWPWVGDKVAQRVADKDNVSIRFALWETGFHMFTQNPAFGVGIGRYPDFQLDAIRDGRVDMFYLEEGQHIEFVRSVDNMYVQFLAEMGLVNLIIYFAKYFAALYLILQVCFHSRHKQLRIIMLATFSGMIAYIGDALTITAYNSYFMTILQDIYFAFVIILYMSFRKKENL